MRSYHEIRERLAQDIVIEIPLTYGDDEDRMTVGREIAEWILMKYEPPVEFEEVPPAEDPFNDPSNTMSWRWTYRLQIFIAGQWIGVKQLMPDGIRHDRKGAVGSVKKHMQRAVGHAIMERLWPL